MRIGSKFKSKAPHAYETPRKVRVTTSEGKPFSSSYFERELGLIEGKVIGYAEEDSGGWVCVEDSKKRPHFVTIEVFETLNETK